jgi:OST-HTH/LOTUS domain
VSPQLGLLKSTLLQLDSTFSERTYGAGSFRDFAQKLAAAGHVTVKEAGRNVLVELADGGASFAGDDGARAPRPEEAARPQSRPRDERPPREERSGDGGGPLGELRTADAVREVRRLFQSAQNPPRWPMYIRQAKQFMRNVDASFDERKFGFASLVDLLRACQRDGLFRMERDRQGVIRLFPGNVMQAVDDTPVAAARPATPGAPRPWQPGDDIPDIHERDRLDTPEPAPASASEVVEGDVVQELETPSVVDGESAPVEEPVEPKKGRGRSRKTAGEGKSARATKQPRAIREPKPKAAAKPRSRAKKAVAQD